MAPKRINPLLIKRPIPPKKAEEEVPIEYEKHAVLSIDDLILLPGYPSLSTRTGQRLDKLIANTDLMVFAAVCRFLLHYRHLALTVVCGGFVSETVIDILRTMFVELTFCRYEQRDSSVKFLLVDGVPKLEDEDDKEESEVKLNELLHDNLRYQQADKPEALGLFYRAPYVYMHDYDESKKSRMNNVFINGVSHFVPYGTRYSTWIFITTQKIEGEYQMNNYDPLVYEQHLSYYNSKVRGIRVYGKNDVDHDRAYIILLMRDYIYSVTEKRGDECNAAADQMARAMLSYFNQQL